MSKVMGTKLLTIFLRVILPENIFDSVLNRIARTKIALRSSSEIQVLGGVFRKIFSPMKSLSGLFLLMIKIIAIWILSARIYRLSSYFIDLLHNDLTSKTERKSLRVALKRVALANEVSTKGRRRNASLGDKNCDRLFYIIRPHYFIDKPGAFSTNTMHLFAHYYYTLGHIALAVESGWIPVVDWENYGPFPHGEEYPINGTNNCWEYYWNQPSDYTLQEVYQSKNVILSAQNWQNGGDYIPVAFAATLQAKNISLQKQAVALAQRCPKYNQLITFNKFTAQYVQEKQDTMFPVGAKILGVSLRATGYATTAINSHTKQPDVHELFQAIHRVIAEWGMDYIFFSCEAEVPVIKFQEEFGERALVLPRMRYIVGHPPTLKEGPLYASGQRYQTNLDYLTEMALLSRCNTLLSSMSNGVQAAIIWNANKYTKMKIIDNGVW